MMDETNEPVFYLADSNSGYGTSLSKYNEYSGTEMAVKRYNDKLEGFESES